MPSRLGRGDVTVWIGGPEDTAGNSIISKRTFLSDELDDVAAWLDGEARQLFPESSYARAGHIAAKGEQATTFGLQTGVPCPSGPLHG